MSFWVLCICMLLMSACSNVDVYNNPNFVVQSIDNSPTDIDKGLVRYKTFARSSLVTLYFNDSLGKYQIGDTITLIKK